MATEILRLGIFSLVLGLMLGAEQLWPRRGRRMDRLIRWPANFGVALLGTVIVRLALPVTAIGVAATASATHIGLLNLMPLTLPITCATGIVALDLAIYLQHRLFHRVPVLWRLHRMHHTDLDVDASTGLRFHPFELLLSMLIKLAVIVALGVPPLAVLVFEITLNASSLFNHANLHIPQRWDAILRRLLVTPDMHRVHHSTLVEETNSNYGFFLSIWDRLFSSYTAQPRLGHGNMLTGLPDYQNPQSSRIDAMLINPFR